MPIKFRCSYCRQFLGISRNRVGGIVDCPTCGRSIRVPGLDGVAAPLPGPELDRDDTHLARALDELAALVHAPVQRPAVEFDAELNDDVEIPQPLPEPEPVELPMPVRMAPVATIDPIGSAVSEVENAGKYKSALDDLLQPVATPAVMESPSRAVERSPATSSLLFVAILPCAAMLLGLAIGWWGRGNPVSSSPKIPDVIVPDGNAVPEPTVGLEGRITYHTAEGEIRPDAAALVLALPETWTGQLRLSPVGLRPGDGEADQAAALIMATALGGKAVRTDDTGRYQVDLPKPGRYQIMVISRFAEREESAPLTAEDLDQLKRFLADPTATVGQRAVHFETVTISASTPTGWDHAF